MSSRFEHIWDELGPEAIFLSPLGALYGLGWLGYKLVYDLGLKKPAEPHSPVLCVGSLMAGGAGKTPVTKKVAEVVQSLGREVAIGMSGYGSQKRQGATLAPEGPLHPATWGDESTVMRDLLPHVPLVVGRDRVAAAKVVAEQLPRHVLLMDDGFQHLPLRKHIQIVLDPADQTNRLPLPAGPYREVWSLGKRRADLVLPSSQFQLRSSPLALLKGGQEPSPLPSEVQLLCAIARPYRLVYGLEQAGARLARAVRLDDHASMSDPGLLDQFDPGIPIVTTLKDWVKLRERPDHERWTFLVLRHDVTIEPEAAFRAWLKERLDALNP